ncbi:MAG: hypothetical protein L0H96_04820 [Humibacillus sp.]|nr:hypothetical protein [Humibacillus sp.]MDN5776212.1 hypothetical protein [Humibacillus sp.]
MIDRVSLARTRTCLRTTLRATVGLAALALLTGCGSASPAPPATTVTVYPDGTTVTPSESGATGSATPPAGPSSVPTVAASSQAPSPSTTTIPTLRVGPLRGAPADFAEASARVSKAPAADAAATSVVSPSGNIFCSIIDDGAGVGCEVTKGRAKAPASAPCPGGGGATDVGRVELTAAGAKPICNSDTIRVPGAPKLAYGKRWSPSGTPFSCLSESVGMTCIDKSAKHALFIARETYATY